MHPQAERVMAVREAAPARARERARRPTGGRVDEQLAEGLRRCELLVDERVVAIGLLAAWEPPDDDDSLHPSVALLPLEHRLRICRSLGPAYNGDLSAADRLELRLARERVREPREALAVLHAGGGA